MFTGIVTAVGRVVGVERRDAVRRIGIRSGYDAAGIDIGASIACAGICLTVVEREASPGGSVFSVEAGPETIALTNIGEWGEGTRLNLERALRIGDELGGHLVAGHVDGLAEVTDRQHLGQTVRFSFTLPPELARFVARKGSVTLDGTSLTVNGVAGNAFDCLLIPHTLAVTTWGDRRPGDRCNIEVDLMARYAARLAEMR